MPDDTQVRQGIAANRNIRLAAKAAAAAAPRFVPGTPQYERLASIWASVPDVAQAPGEVAA